MSLLQALYALHVEENEVSLDIHPHCYHCYTWKCKEKNKPGWCCDIIKCPSLCGMRFHECKLDEHKMMCSHEQIECLNKEYGCPHTYPRYLTERHLPSCPASVVVCTAQWNRWAMGSKDREKVSLQKGATKHFKSTDLDMALALHDQELVNEMHELPKWLRKMFCNKITRRFPSLPLTIKGCHHNGPYEPKAHLEKEEKVETSSDDITELCCVHSILQDLCMFCRNDPKMPDYTIGKVWREVIDPENPGLLKWTHESRIEKIKKRDVFGQVYFKMATDSDDEDEKMDAGNLLIDDKGKPIGSLRLKTPPPSSLTSEGLSLELPIKHYCPDQKKPRAMLTFQCMKEMRRDEYISHYKNVHCEIHEGLDGWLLQRCPLHLYGCPFYVTHVYPGNKDANIVYCDMLQAFGVKPLHSFEHLQTDANKLLENTIEKKTLTKNKESKEFYKASSLNIMYLPMEILQIIASYLDSFSLNNLALTSKHMRDVCSSLLSERGLVVPEWVRHTIDKKVVWKQDRMRWFYSKCFDPIEKWNHRDYGLLSNHLQECPYNKRHVSAEKFVYVIPLAEELNRLRNKSKRTSS